MSGLYGFLSNFQQKLGNIFPRIKKFGFTPALVGINRYRFCGPGNPLHEQPATNRTDAICEKHDREYDRIFKDNNLNEYQKKQAIYDADTIFRREQKEVYRDNSYPLLDRAVSNISDKLIGVKMFFDRQSFEPSTVLDTTYI